MTNDDESILIMASAISGGLFLFFFSFVYITGDSRVFAALGWIFLLLLFLFFFFFSWRVIYIYTVSAGGPRDNAAYPAGGQ